jgi:ubiquinone/menaquinone biosynthesis C-methylase UbiE
MENDQEAIRLDLKTDPESFKRQVLWAGLKPAMRVADLGCGAGITTYSLHELLPPGTEILGIDFSQQRIEYAQKHYSEDGITYFCRDIRHNLDDLGTFDFVCIRFVLEYYYSESFKILQNVSRILNPGGIMCLIDLDHNCLNHFGLPPRLITAISGIIQKLYDTADFDPYAGRRLYSYLFDLGFTAIDVQVTAHHLFFGEMQENQIFNSIKKLEVAGKKSGYGFEEYGGNYEAFFKEFNSTFFHPRRFSYTPVICCRGCKL